MYELSKELEMEKMTAEEIFEELGYCRFEDNGIILYNIEYKDINFMNNEEKIFFDKRFKNIQYIKNRENFGIQFTVEMDLYKAIQKQIEELGW